MSETPQDNADTASLTRTHLFKGYFFNAYILRNQSQSTVETPFADHAHNAIALSTRASIESFAGKRKRKWFPFARLDATQFYSFTLKQGQWVMFLHGPNKKSAGYLSSSVNSEQASYVYTYTHENDPHKKTVDDMDTSDLDEREKCVI